MTGTINPVSADLSESERSAERRLDSTLSKGLTILEYLAVATTGKSVTEVSRDLSLTKSNAFRLLQTLVALGYVRQLETKHYQATLKAWQIGVHVIEGLNLREIAASEMQFLSRETGDTVYLAVPQDLSVVYIDKIDSRQPIRSWNPVGGSAPIHAVSTGKAIIAADYAFWRPRLHGKLTKHTEKTITTLVSLDADVEKISSRGFASDAGEFRDRVLGFGAAILLPNGKPIAAIGTTMPDVNLAFNGEERQGQLVMSAAHKISQKLRD